MPVRRLPVNPSLAHLKHQAKDLLKGRAARSPAVAQQIREFHPGFLSASDSAIFQAPLKLSDAQLTIAREHGFPGWNRLKTHIQSPAHADRLDLLHHERIEDAVFRHAVDLIDSGDAVRLQLYLSHHPRLIHQRVLFEGGNYFRNPTLLEFIAENPIRHGTLPPNIVQVARVLLDAGPHQSSRNDTLVLVVTGSVSHACHLQLPLIDLLCDYGADPAFALQAAALHGELATVSALLERGAPLDLPVAAALGRLDAFTRLLPASTARDRHLALALAAQYGRVDHAHLLLDAGEDPNRYNPLGGHAHATPLHQAAGFGHLALVQLLIERGALLDFKDVLWQATPVEWAHHEGKAEVESYLRAQSNTPPPKQERTP